MNELLQLLDSMAPGCISDTAKLERLLAENWDEFDGSDAEAMAAYKLIGRMEEVFWNPPVLRFSVHHNGCTLQVTVRLPRPYPGETDG